MCDVLYFELIYFFFILLVVNFIEKEEIWVEYE